MPDREDIAGLLERLFPFRFLSPQERMSLAADCRRIEGQPGETLIRSGNSEDRTVYLIASGSVEVVHPLRGRTNTIEAPGYVGEWEPLFDVARVMEIRALTDLVAYAISGERFLRLLHESRTLALSLRTILRDRQGLFSAFDRFRAELLRAVGEGHVNIQALIPFYKELQPALHPHASDDDRIDYEALAYAVRRLPSNVGRTFAFLLVDELPAIFDRPDHHFPPVETEARRRDIWEMLPGKNLVLLRHGLSDLVDLVTCLCLYAVEARKIRRRVLLTDSFEAIQRAAEGRGGVVPAFDSREMASFSRIWPDSGVQRVYDIARHREMFSVDIRRHTGGYNQRRSEVWAEQVAQATRELFGHEPASLPEDLSVHIVSSNTHSVTNCLNPWWSGAGPEILAWAREGGHELYDHQWTNPSDRLYAVARDYFRSRPDALREARDVARRHGIITLEETTSTGIQVQLIDTSRLEDLPIDPGIERPPRSGPRLIVNIDYAFGEQAEDIIRNLNMLFGRRLASINFLGKAGALVGERGDVLVPTAFIRQNADLFQPVETVTPENCARLEAALAPKRLHHGPMLTVDGTLLQNREMLGFYRHLWNVVGIEMEGFHYYRQVLESVSLGVLPPTVRLGFFYYVSDKPLDAGASLSARLNAAEGIPPLYAITRHILRDIFDYEA